MIPLYMNTSETEGVVVYPLDMDCIIPMAIFENIFIFQPTYFVCVQFVLRTTAFYVSFGSQKAQCICFVAEEQIMFVIAFRQPCRSITTPPEEQA